MIESTNAICISFWVPMALKDGAMVIDEADDAPEASIWVHLDSSEINPIPQ